jgi:membrane fusion protein (multidrug efflux system)
MLFSRLPGGLCGRHSAWALAGLSLLTLALSGCQKEAAPAAAAAPPTAVGTFTVQAARVQLATELPGRVGAPVVSEVRPQVGGLIQARRFTEGALVKAGQLLYQIDPESYRVALASAEAALARAQATRDAARLTVQRREDLGRIEAISQQDRQDAQTALAQAEADLAAARATRDSAALNLRRTQVVAPITGWADVSSVTAGALVTAEQTTALTTVRQIDPVQVDISQSSAELMRLRQAWAQGQLQRSGAQEAKVSLLLEDGSRYPLEGRLGFTGVSVNTGTGAVTLRAWFSNPKGTLLPGMYVRAVLDTGALPQGLVVPQQAVLRDSRGKPYVLVVDASSRVERRSVSVGSTFGTGWLVNEGLKAGEVVIVEGLQKVKAGDTVQPREVDAAAPAKAASVPAMAQATAPAAAAR